MKNIGLVGWGFIGKTHFDAYQQIESANVAAVFSKNDEQKIDGPNWKKVRLVKTYEALLNDPQINIIDICLPTFLHEEFIIKAAEAKKDIICEKPLSLTVESVERIIGAVQRNKVRLFIAHVLRFWPEYKAIKSYYDTGKLNHIEFIHAGRLGQVPKWNHWFKYPEKSGGALYDLHIHDIDFICYLLGDIKTVYAVGSKNENGAWDHIMTTLTLKNGAKALVEASHRMPTAYPFSMFFRIQGGDAAIDFRLSAGNNIERITQSSVHYYKSNEKSSIDIPQENAFQNELSYFINCVENNEENNIIPLNDVLATMKMMEAIQTSLESEQIVQLSSVE
ncbi:Gfo/Idh/MocA family oxidoreductase [Robertmurraya sp. DFI.2.37]|uniref:Gfo/Idh/MocA family protein n=1 Tax=Robertmurraya sp. DFI.2.37 TaxID=3031819 RepID=UPI001246D9B0|nr:Gfo/Idh/MocA family oxidoreductase [Robertmurraya sp. DFI.2.37]MDF1508499.1 Gfo/Idh/MocA family oxidoreductase [Robertmurraya sp. DFI.2.37]